MTVMIDGVRYVPVSDAINDHIDAPRILDALMTQWYGTGWQQSYPHGPDRCRVVVSDDFDEDEGETARDFVARLITTTS